MITDPSSGDSQPFSHANCWYVVEGDNKAPSFKPLSAVMHWLINEWGQGGSDLKNSLAEQGVKEELAQKLHKSYVDSADEWVGSLNHALAIAALKTLFICFKREGYPYGTTNYRDIEPKRWSENPDVRKATREMLRLHAMLRVGASSLSAQFNAPPLDARHALLGNSFNGESRSLCRRVMAYYPKLSD